MSGAVLPLSDDEKSSRPAHLKWRSSKFFIVFVVDFAVFTDSFLYGLIVPVAPTALQQRTGLPEDQVQRWTSILLALYGAAVVVLSPTCGYLTDRVHKRKPLFLAGLISLAAATALLCIGSHLALWILGRLFQGASTAVIWTVGMTLLVDNIEAGTLGRAMGSVSMAMVIGCMAGPLLGGVLYEYGSYYAPFALSFGLLAVSFVLRLALIESRYTKQSLDHDSTQISPIAYNNGDEHEPQEKEHVQGVENGRNSVGPHSTCITNLSPESTYASSGILSPQLCGCLVILLRSPRMITVLWVYLVTSVTTTAFDSFLPLFVRDIFGWKQTAQGLVFITLIIPNLLDVVSGYIIDRIPKSRRYLTAGAFLFSVPLIVCLRFIDQNSLQDKVLLCALLALIGLCMGVTQSPITVELSCLVLEMETRYPDVFGKGGAVALAYGLLNSSFALGSTIAPFMGGYLRDRVGWATMCLVLAMPAGVSGLLVLIFFGK